MVATPTLLLSLAPAAYGCLKKCRDILAWAGLFVPTNESNEGHGAASDKNLLRPVVW